MPNEEFSYANLNQRLLQNHEKHIIGENEPYMATLGDPGGLVGPLGFVYLSYIGEPSPNITDEGQSFHRSKLKFHVSLPEGGQQLARGWDIIKDILIAHRVGVFKVVEPGQRMSSGDGSQRGKEITIEAFFNREKTAQGWLQIMQEIHSS